MAYGNEDYRDFHYKSWKNLDEQQQGYFGGNKDSYRSYKEDYGLDGFKSAKDKAQTYQYDKQWKDMDEDYQAMHTKQQHSAARKEWKAGKSTDWDSTSDAYKMMIDKNLHSSWYKPPSTNSGGSDPFNDTRGNTPTGPVAPGASPNPPANPITNGTPGSGGQGNGPTPNNNYGAKPEKQEGEKTADYRDRKEAWKAGEDSSYTPPTPSADDPWSWNDPSKFWDKHTDGQTWGQVEDKDKYGDERRLAYMSDAMGWGSYENLNNRLKTQWENRGGRDAYVASKDFVKNYDSGSSGSDPSGSSGGGGGGVTDGGVGDNPTTIVIDNGNSGGYEGPTFAEQQILAQEQRSWQEAENKLARDEAQADREESRKEARIQTIIAGMNAAKNGNSWQNQGGGRGPIWGGSGYSRGQRQGFSPWR